MQRNGACESTVQSLCPSSLIFLTFLHCRRQNCGWRGAGFRVHKDPCNTVLLENVTVAKLVKNSTPLIKPEICRVKKTPLAPALWRLHRVHTLTPKLLYILIFYSYQTNV
jgi:hypothetical protein